MLLDERDVALPEEVPRRQQGVGHAVEVGQPGPEQVDVGDGRPADSTRRDDAVGTEPVLLRGDLTEHRRAVLASEKAEVDAVTEADRRQVLVAEVPPGLDVDDPDALAASPSEPACEVDVDARQATGGNSPAAE